MARRPDKSKRYRQNKAVREARAARSARAGEATAIARGERTPASAPAATETADEKGQERPARTKGGRPRRQSPWTQPGQRAVFLALMFSVVSAITLLVSDVPITRDVPADDPRVEEQDADVEDGRATITDDVRLIEEESPAVAGLILLLPVAITGAAVYFAKHEKRATIWNVAMLGLAACLFLSGPYAFFLLPALVALGVGGFQARRVESKARLAELKAERAKRKAEGGEVIDVEPVEDDR